LLTKEQLLNIKELISLQHRGRAIKSEIQNSTNHFFWDNVIARSHCTYNPLDVTGSPQYSASEIAADEIATQNWPPMQRADILNRRLAFRRHQFTPTHN